MKNPFRPIIIGFVFAAAFSALCAVSAVASAVVDAPASGENILLPGLDDAYAAAGQQPVYVADEERFRLPVVEEPPLPEASSSGLDNFKRAFSNTFTVYYSGEHTGEFARRHSVEHGIKDFSNYEGADATKGAVREVAGKDVDAKVVLYDSGSVEVREALSYNARKLDLSSGTITFKTTVHGATLDNMDRVNLVEFSVKKPYGIAGDPSSPELGDEVFARNEASISTKLKARPFRWLTADFKSDIDPETRRVNNIHESLVLSRLNGDAITVSYTHAKGFTREVSAEARYMVAEFAAVGYGQRYSFLDNKVIGRDYSLHLIHKCWGNTLVSTVNPNDKYAMPGCWGADITYTSNGPENRAVMFTVTITGVRRALSGN